MSCLSLILYFFLFYMPTSTWKVASACSDGIADVVATHYDADGSLDASFSSRLKVGATDDIERFVELSKKQLVDEAKIRVDSSDFARSIEVKLNS